MGDDPLNLLSHRVNGGGMFGKNFGSKIKRGHEKKSR